MGRATFLEGFLWARYYAKYFALCCFISTSQQPTIFHILQWNNNLADVNQLFQGHPASPLWSPTQPRLLSNTVYSAVIQN